MFENYTFKYKDGHRFFMGERLRQFLKNAVIEALTSHSNSSNKVDCNISKSLIRVFDNTYVGDEAECYNLVIFTGYRDDCVPNFGISFDIESYQDGSTTDSHYVSYTVDDMGNFENAFTEPMIDELVTNYNVARAGLVNMILDQLLKKAVEKQRV